MSTKLLNSLDNFIKFLISISTPFKSRFSEFSYWLSPVLVYFFESLITHIGVFLMRNWGYTPKFAKTIPKKGYFWCIRYLSAQIWSTKVFSGRWSRILESCVHVSELSVHFSGIFCKFKGEALTHCRQDPEIRDQQPKKRIKTKSSEGQ